MSTRRAVLISCFNYYDIRLKHVESYLLDKNYEVIYITSDYDHIGKKPYTVNRQGTLQVHAMPYKKNLSFRRMLSHFVWSQKVFKRIVRLQPTMLFVMLPPNSLAKHAAKYCLKNKTKLVFDIYDLWPETYPLQRYPFLKVLFTLWRLMRDRYLKVADLITTECNLFRETLGIGGDDTKTAVLYPALEDIEVKQEMSWDAEVMHYAYLGSINNIVDISAITDLVRETIHYLPVHVHIIGTGESKGRLISSIKNVGGIVSDYGAVYDEKTKQSILNSCRFGLNIMRKTVCVGLTMKSIDYFRAGLPIINTIKGDTQNLVSEENIGFNLESINMLELVGQTRDEHFVMRNKVKKVFSENFSTAAFREKLIDVLEKVVC